MSSNQFSQNSQFDPATERGVHNPLVIDLIAFDSTLDRVTLSMVETREWDENSEQSEQFQEKLNNYLDYVLDGYLAQQYPNYRGKPIELKLSCSYAPTAKFLQLFGAAQRYLKSIGWEFSIDVEQPSS